MKRLDYISILRTISIFFVVCFHVYGFMYADHFPETKEIYKDTYYWLNQCVLIMISMPLFTFIAGFLFQYLYSNKHKYRDFIPFAKTKFQRLWMPYLVFGVIMMATTNNFHPLRLLDGGYWHLWYLPRLFWCFMVAWCINRWINNVRIRLALLPLFLFLSIINWKMPILIGIQGIHRWMGWFYLGMMIAEHQESVHYYLKKYYLSIPLCAIYLYLIVNHPTEYGKVTVYSICAGISIIIVLWQIFSQLSQKYLDLLSPLASISKYSFGIYIFHNWVGLYLVGNFSQRIFHLPELANHIILFPACLTIVDFGISLLLTWLLMKTKVGRLLIG